MPTAAASASRPAAPVRYTFRKAERLCSRRLLDGLFKHGTAFNTYPLRFVVWQTGAGTVVSGDDGKREADQPPRNAAPSVGVGVESAKVGAEKGGADSMAQPQTPTTQHPTPGTEGAQTQVESSALPNTQHPTPNAQERPQLSNTAHPASLRVVLSVSKRHFKRATDRNRIKRLLREAWRHCKPELLAALTQPHGGGARLSAPLLVAVLYIGKEKPDSLAALSKRLRKGLQRLTRAELPDAPPPSST